MHNTLRIPDWTAPDQSQRQLRASRIWGSGRCIHCKRSHGWRICGNCRATGRALWVRREALKHIVHTSMVQYHPMPYAQRETCHEKIGTWPRQSPHDSFVFWLSLFFVAPCTHHQKIQYMEQTRPFAAWVYNHIHTQYQT